MTAVAARAGSRGGPRAAGLGLGFLLIALAACIHDVVRIEPIAPVPPPRSRALRVLLFGDFGLDTAQQRLAARGMARAQAEHPFDLALQLGDNLYFCGPDPTRPGAEGCRFEADGATVAAGAAPPDDPIFRVNEAPLEALRGSGGASVPVFLALGNHDVASDGRCAAPGLGAEEAARRRACLSVAHRSPTWVMPARHYVIDRGPVRIVVLDTNVVVGDYGGFTLDDEIAFVRRATEGCGPDRPCFLAGHHPPAAVHGYRARRSPLPSPLQLRMARLLEATGGRARAIFAGHVHTLEHLSLDGLEVFVSGSTAMGGVMRFKVRAPARAQLRFATTAWGYAVLEAGADGYRVELHDFTGAALHCCEAGREGPCRPVECG
jgi:hypothetical protein